MTHTGNFDEFVQATKKFADHLTQQTFDELRDYIYIDTPTKKYHMLPHVGGFLGKNGFEGRTFREMLLDKLEEIDSKNNCVNYFGAMTENDISHKK